MPKYQVTMQNYFCIPNPRAFDNINANGGRVIKGSAIMGFSDNSQQCLDNAARDLRIMGCVIFYKKCQEVDTVALQILIRAPNTIEEDIIKQTMDKELKKIESTLLLSDKNYKLTREQSKNWIRYAVVKDFPAEMPWEGLEEKKQKQGISNACLAYVLHVHQPDHKRMKNLLACAKAKRTSGTRSGEIQHLPLKHRMIGSQSGSRPNTFKWFKHSGQCSLVWEQPRLRA
jgi:hypothetical protein